MATIIATRKATNAERGDDFNASPYAALPPLLVAENRHLPRVLWEPSCGNGALVLPLRNRGHVVYASDLNDWGCPNSSVIDFFDHRAAPNWHPPVDDWGIVTNPPYNCVEDYIERATSLAPYVALLLRLAFLESEGRMNWFPQVGLRRVHIIAERLPMMHRHDYTGKRLEKSGMAFAWFIFERERKPVKTVPLRWVSYKAACKLYPQTEADVPPDARGQQLPLLEQA